MHAGDHQEERGGTAEGLNPKSPNGLLGPKRLCKPHGAFKRLFLPYLLPEWIPNTLSKHSTQCAVGKNVKPILE